MKKLSIDYALILSMLTVAALAACGAIERAGTVGDVMMAIALVFYGPAGMRSIVAWLRPQSGMLSSWSWDNPRSIGITETARRIQRIHCQVFVRELRQRGAISRDLRAVPMPRRTHGRQHGGASTSARQSASGKSSDDDGGDGEPPLLPFLFPFLPLLFTFTAFAQAIGCSTKTLRNKVSAGLFPKPIQTRFGPRFTQSHLALVLTPQQPPADNPLPKRGPGRPRIALPQQSMGDAK